MKYGVFFSFLLILLPAAAQDSSHITVHIIYGSKPAAPGENKWFGGKWGGHIGLQVGNDKIVHFNPGGKVRVFGKKSQPGTWVLSSINHFYCTFGCDTVKTMRVTIPVPKADKLHLDTVCGSFLNNAPYPYAFFGMRCTSACYHLLAEAAIFPEHSKGKMIRKFFYPRRLRRFLLRHRGGDWVISGEKGTNRRKWDHD